MRRPYFIIAALLLSGVATARAQNATPTPTPQQQQRTAPPAAQRQQPQQRQRAVDLLEYGAQIKPEPRLIAVMAALDAAGFDPTPKDEEPSVFRAQLRRDLAGLDPALRQRMVAFYERNKLKEVAGRAPTPAEQAARYVSLAYALGPAPEFQEPPRSLDLPSGLLEVMDFAPLVREFYRKSGLDERMPVYLRSYQEEGNRLRRSTAAMIMDVVSYLNTRPITTTIERIAIKSPESEKPKKNAPQRFETREHDRRFVVVPDLLAAPGTTNFRVITDDYFVIVPYCDETKRNCAGRDDNPASPELRRAYIQYVVDPLVVRFGRDIAARREQLKQLLDARTAAGASVSPDVFLMVTRSLVAAVDARIEEVVELQALTRDATARMDKVTDQNQRAEIVKELEARRAAISDETVAQLAEAYENGAALSFYFAEQLRGVESSGFDVSNSLADMIASFDPARELKRLDEADAARKRALAARKEREAQRAETAATPAAQLPNAALVKKLLDVDKLVRMKNYAAAEEQLLALVREFPGEPRVFFALAETANLSARDATDEMVQSQRLNKAFTNYRNAVQAAATAQTETDHCLLVRAHEAMGRILEFFEQPTEAVKEFDAAIQINDASCESYRAAVEGKKRLAQSQ